MTCWLSVWESLERLSWAKGKSDAAKVKSESVLERVKTLRCGQPQRYRCALLRLMVLYQDAHVLDGCDQVILDLLAPESPPTRALEVMVVGRIGKARFYELLPPLSIASRRRAMATSRASWYLCLWSVRPAFALVHCTRSRQAAHAPVRALYSMVWRKRFSRRGFRISPAGQRKV